MLELRFRVATLKRFSFSWAALCVVTTHAHALDIKEVEPQDEKAITILLSGRVNTGDGLKVRGFVAGLPPGKPIVAQLALEGGVRSEAMSIGRFFYQTRIRTLIPGKGTRCVSPCPLVLVGGRDGGTGNPNFFKYSTGSLGFSGITLNYQDKEYTVKDLDSAVASTQREILQVADYLQGVGANMEMLRYYHSVIKDQVKYIGNDEALDLGVAVLVEETGQLIEPSRLRRN